MRTVLVPCQDRPLGLLLMSALGQKQTLRHVRTMSALPPKADIAECDRHVRFVPKADIRPTPIRSRRRQAVGGVRGTLRPKALAVFRLMTIFIRTSATC